MPKHTLGFTTYTRQQYEDWHKGIETLLQRAASKAEPLTRAMLLSKLIDHCLETWETKEVVTVQDLARRLGSNVRMLQEMRPTKLVTWVPANDPQGLLWEPLDATRELWFCDNKDAQQGFVKIV